MLHETAPTCSSLIGLRRDTCALAAFSVDTARRRHARIWAYESLPWGMTRLAAGPPPLGGALVTGLNFLLFRSQARIFWGVG